MFHGHLDYFQKTPLEGKPNKKPRDHGTPNAHNCWFILFYHVWGPAWIENHWNSIRLTPQSHMTHTTLKNPWPHFMMLEVCWDVLWTLSFGLSQFHGHGSCLVCEVAFMTLGKVISSSCMSSNSQPIHTWVLARLVIKCKVCFQE